MPKSISKIMNKLLKSNDFLGEVYKKSKSPQHFNDLLGMVLEYYITTRDTKLRSLDEIAHCDYDSDNEKVIKNKKRNETISQAKTRNIITNGYVTHSANGYNKRSIKKYGLGHKKIYDEQLGKDLLFLEEKTEKSEYVSNQVNSTSEIYYTSPGANSFHYATSFSPERLFLGPLRQDKNNALPIIIGETKEEYMIRLAERKVRELTSPKDQKKVLKVYSRVIHKLCSAPPIMVLIPIKNKKFELNASNAYQVTDNPRSLSDWIDIMASKDTGFFSRLQGGSDHSNMGNLVSIGVKVPANCLEIIDVPDGFEVLQKIAIAQGMKKGDQIDFFTGKPYVQQNNLQKNSPNSMENAPTIATTINQVNSSNTFAENFKKKIGR